MNGLPLAPTCIRPLMLKAAAVLLQAAPLTSNLMGLVSSCQTRGVELKGCRINDVFGGSGDREEEEEEEEEEATMTVLAVSAASPAVLVVTATSLKLNPPFPAS